MPDPISLNSVSGGGSIGGVKPAAESKPAGEGDFASLMKDQLQKVSAMQSEADAKVEQFLTGQSDNMTDVFVAARKAQVAFSLLMEMRNKLVDAYQELQNMRV